METAESRRRAGRIIASARKRTKTSQRELARRAGISETWLRAITSGLRGDAPQRASDETWLRLAQESGAEAPELFAALGRPMPDWVQERQPAEDESPRYQVEERRRGPLGERVWQIVRDLEADTEGIPDDVAEQMIQRAMDNAEAQARIMLDAERRRWERQQRDRADT